MYASYILSFVFKRYLNQADDIYYTVWQNHIYIIAKKS